MTLSFFVQGSQHRHGRDKEIFASPCSDKRPEREFLPLCVGSFVDLVLLWLPNEWIKALANFVHIFITTGRKIWVISPDYEKIVVSWF